MESHPGTNSRDRIAPRAHSISGIRNLHNQDLLEPNNPRTYKKRRNNCYTVELIPSSIARTRERSGAGLRQVEKRNPPRLDKPRKAKGNIGEVQEMKTTRAR